MSRIDAGIDDVTGTRPVRSATEWNRGELQGDGSLARLRMADHRERRPAQRPGRPNRPGFGTLDIDLAPVRGGRELARRQRRRCGCRNDPRRSGPAAPARQPRPPRSNGSPSGDGPGVGAVPGPAGTLGKSQVAMSFVTMPIDRRTQPVARLGAVRSLDRPPRDDQAAPQTKTIVRLSSGRPMTLVSLAGRAPDGRPFRHDSHQCPRAAGPGCPSWGRGCSPPARWSRCGRGTAPVSPSSASPERSFSAFNADSDMSRETSTAS